MPVGAFGARSEIMDYLAPLGPVYQAGTLSGNPVAMAAGIAALQELAATDAYTKLEKLGAALESGMKDAAKSAGVSVQFNRCGSMFCAYFTSEPVHNLADAMKSDRERFKKYFHDMLNEGVYFAPSQFEAGFLSTAHTAEDVEKTVQAASRVLKTIRKLAVLLLRAWVLKPLYNRGCLKMIPAICLRSTTSSREGGS